ncbi:MAG: hypothetical protein QXP97_02965 [Desulfurococcus sp.]
MNTAGKPVENKTRGMRRAGGVLGIIIRLKDEGIKYEFAGFSLVK